MIVLDEIALKLSELLNDPLYGNPADFNFMVETAGVHLDTIRKEDKNFIPVFISSFGGTFNPVPHLKELTATVQVTLYFPVRFKEEFYALNDFLAENLVGTYLNWGSNSGKCVSNISLPTFGEIQNLDLNEFKQWVSSVYRKEISITEPYMSMNFSLYLTSASASFVFGNEVTLTLQTSDTLRLLFQGVCYYRIPDMDNSLYAWANYKGTIYTNFLSGGGDVYQDGEIIGTGTVQTLSETSENLTFDEGAMSLQSLTQDQQIMGETEAGSAPYGSSLVNSFSVYLKNSAFWLWVLKRLTDGALPSMKFTLNVSCSLFNITRDCFVSMSNLPFRKGEVLKATITLGRLANGL